MVRIGSKRYRSLRTSFWSLLAKALGMPKRTLRLDGPGRVASGDFAQTVGSAAFWSGKRGLVAGRFGGSSLVGRTRDVGESFTETFRAGGSIAGLGVAGTNFAWVATTACERIHQNCIFRSYTSRDGGASWQEVTSTQVRPVQYLNADTAWGILADPAPTTGVAFEISRDGGRTWTASGPRCPTQGLFAPRFPDTVAFASLAVGYALCDTGPMGTDQSASALYRTTDGGATWARIRTATVTSGFTPGMTFVPGGYGWMWAERGELVRSADGGRTWQRVGLAVPDVVTVQSLQFFTPGAGVALAQGPPLGGSALVATRDGGITWTVTHVLVRESP